MYRVVPLVAAFVVFHMYCKLVEVQYTKAVINIYFNESIASSHFTM